ncbi:MAG: pirin family protein, partial [Mycobacterium sp.]|nr:pirin family protein [Mycobacterium sp.]
TETPRQRRRLPLSQAEPEPRLTLLNLTGKAGSSTSMRPPQNGVIYPGLAQRMSAGRGILHSEKNDSWNLGGEKHTQPVHFVQMWVVPDETGRNPQYQQLEIDRELLAGDLITIASGMPAHRNDAAITLGNRYAALHGARLQAGDTVELPDAPYLHVFAARGAVALEDEGDLHAGDAARITAAGGQRLIANGAAEVLVWEMHARVA